MLNAPETYAEVGRQTAIARNQGDEARALFHARHFRAMRALETEEDRKAVDVLYDEAYRESRKV